MTGLHLALWFVPVSHRPTIEAGRERLEYLDRNGVTPYSFGIKVNFRYSETQNYAILK